MNYAMIIGNLCTLLAMGFNSLSSTRKTAKGVLRVQNLSQLMYFITAIVLRGYSAAVQNVVSVLRNVAAIRNVKSKVVEWILTAAGVILGVVFNNMGLIGLLPVLGNLQYTLAIFRFKNDERKLKIFFLISVICYAVFNFVIGNYVGAASDTIVVVTTSVMLLKKQKKTEE